MDGPACTIKRARVRACAHVYVTNIDIDLARAPSDLELELDIASSIMQYLFNFKMDYCMHAYGPLGPPT